MSSEARKILDEIVKETEEKRSIEVARDMLSTKRYSIEEVAEISRLSLAEVKNIAVSYS